MVSRTIFISVAILLLSTVTFAERQTNSLENDSRVNFRPLKRRSTFARPLRRRQVLGGLLNNGLSTHEMKVSGASQTNDPTASNQRNGGGGIQGTTKSGDPDEQDGDVFGEGDDQPDSPGQHEAKRSLDSPFSKDKPIAPGSVTEPFALRRRALQPDDDEDEDRSDDDDALEDIDDQDTTHEAKRDFSDDIDRFIMKTQIGVDEIIYKTGQMSGGDDDTTSSSGLPDGHSISTSNKHANDAINKAKSISSASIKDDVKAMHDNH